MRFRSFEIGETIAGRTIVSVHVDSTAMTTRRYWVRYLCGHVHSVRHVDIKRAARKKTTGKCRDCARGRKIADYDPAELTEPAYVCSEESTVPLSIWPPVPEQKPLRFYFR